MTCGITLCPLPPQRSPNTLTGKLLGMAVRALLGRPAPGALETHEARDCWIRTRTRHPRVARDGEVAAMTSPLHYRSRPGALNVLVPASDARPPWSAEHQPVRLTFPRPPLARSWDPRPHGAARAPLAGPGNDGKWEWRQPDRQPFWRVHPMTQSLHASHDAIRPDGAAMKGPPVCA